MPSIAPSLPVNVCRSPKAGQPIEAASLPETMFTVWINVFERGRLAPGETLLVQGGASGIGVTAIQMVRALGHRVFVTAGSPEKCSACESLGAERAINYRTEDFVEVVWQLTSGRGVDVILDMVAGELRPPGAHMPRRRRPAVHHRPARRQPGCKSIATISCAGV